MTESRDAVIGLAERHYEKSDRPLFLASVGQYLRDQNLWPFEGETRTLKEWLQSLEPDLVVIQDEQSPARVAVVTPDKAAVVEQTLLLLRATQLVQALARPVLLAFCIRGHEDQPVFLTRTPPFRFTLIEPADPQNYWVIAPEFRQPGVHLRAVAQMPAGAISALGAAIERWALAQGVDLATLTKAAAETERGIGEEPTAGTLSALDRLIAAQRPALRADLVVPADIAALLSRHR